MNKWYFIWMRPVSIEMEQKNVFLKKKIQNGWLKKNLIFQLQKFSNFLMKISWIGLVELIDMKAIGVSNLYGLEAVWHKLKNSLFLSLV